MACRMGGLEKARPDLKCHCVMIWLGAKWHVLASRVDMDGLVSYDKARLGTSDGSEALRIG